MCREIPCLLVFVIKFDTHTTSVLSQIRNMIPFLLTMDGKVYVSLHTHNVYTKGRPDPLGGYLLNFSFLTLCSL